MNYEFTDSEGRERAGEPRSHLQRLLRSGDPGAKVSEFLSRECS